ncbi:MAG: hypothetical protein Q8S43_09340 [Actinomycetota bacterium]|nr:hypothetical protein [Actinomycetota bacterium]
MTATDALHLLKQERGLVIAVIVLAIIGAVVAGRIMPPAASATAQVQVYDDARAASLLGIGDGIEAPEHDVLMDTHIRLATSPTIAKRVIDRLGLTDTSHIVLERVTVTALGRSTVLAFKATAPDADAAVKLADTWVAEYLAWRTESISSDLTAASAALAPRITAAEAQLAEVEARIKAGGHTKEIDTALIAAGNDYEELLADSARLELLASVEGPPLSIVSGATVEDASQVLSIAINALKGLIAGALLAVLLVFVRHRPTPASQPE